MYFKARLTLLIAACMLTSSVTFSQQYTEDDKKEGLLKQKQFYANEAAFEQKSVPDKWKTESAVILAQKFEYSFLQKHKNIEFEQAFRKRIKLQDKASVEEFSQFYWQAPYSRTGMTTLFGGDNSNKFYIEIKIIKPNGSVVEVNTRDAVEVKETEWRNVPRIFRGGSGTGYKKLAIPNLETGDIIDYFYFKRVFVPDAGSYDFGETTVTLSEKYPILEQKYALILERQFYINLNTYNGAPKFSARADQLKYTGLKANDKVMVYSLEDQNREKFGDEPWSYELVHNPIIKFRVIYAMTTPSALVGEERGVLKEKFSPEEIIEHFQRDFKYRLSSAAPAYEVKYVQTNLGKEKDVKKLADELYYAVRFYNIKNSRSFYKVYAGGYTFAYKTVPLKKFYENFAKELDYIKYENEMMTKAVESKQYGIMQTSVNSSSARATFCKGLEKLKIPYRILLVPERQFGKIDDLLFEYEYEPVVVVEDGSKRYFYHGIGSDRTPEITNYNLEGSEGIAYSPVTWKKDKKVERMTIPVSDPSFSRLNIKTQLSFDPAAFEQLPVKREILVTGDFKYDYSYLNWMNDSSDFEDMRIYEKDFAKKFKPKYITGYKVKEAESRRLIGEYYPLRYKVVKAYTEENIKEDYAMDKLDTLYLIQNGRYTQKKDLLYCEKFKMKELAAKLGPNYTFNIGKLIGDQLTFEDKDKKDRKTDINIVFPRTIEYECVIDIPAGYKIEGIKECNISVDNEAASFTSTVTSLDNTILIKTKKVYKHNFEKKANWNKLVDVTQAAYNFSQKKIILKKA